MKVYKNYRYLPMYNSIVKHSCFVNHCELNINQQCLSYISLLKFTHSCLWHKGDDTLPEKYENPRVQRRYRFKDTRNGTTNFKKKNK